MALESPKAEALRKTDLHAVHLTLFTVIYKAQTSSCLWTASGSCRCRASRCLSPEAYRAKAASKTHCQKLARCARSEGHPEKQAAS